MEHINDYWREQSKQFDKAVDYYDKFRPGYPKELVSCIVEKTGICEGVQILEIGAGSGKAAELFVKEGFHMHCVEPGENLAKMGMKKFSYTDKVKYYISLCFVFSTEEMIVTRGLDV